MVEFLLKPSQPKLASTLTARLTRGAQLAKLFSCCINAQEVTVKGFGSGCINESKRNR